MSDAATDYADALDALAGVHSAEALRHRGEADRLAHLVDLAGGHAEPHRTALITFRRRSADQAAARAAAASLAAESCIAGAEALRSIPRAAPT